MDTKYLEIIKAPLITEKSQTGKYLNIEEIAQIMKETESSVRWALKKLGYR